VAALGQFSIYTDGGWEYGGDGMDAPFYPYTDSPSHKGGGSVVFITTDLPRLQSQNRQEGNAALSYVAIRIDQGEEVGRGPNPQELLALLVALGCERKLGRPLAYNEEISSDCKSVVDYVNNHRQTRLRNEVGKLPFLMAIQQYMQEADYLKLRWVQSHPERRKDQADFTMDDWGIYVADCYASNKPVPKHLRGFEYKVKASEMVREVFPRSLWYLGDKGSLPIMVDPKRRYQDLRMEQYWRNRDGQVGHEETYQGSTTYIMHVAGELRYLNMRQKARRVKLMLDWVVHGRRMQLMGVDSSGLCPICMERDSLEHMIFECRYSVAIQKRQTWSDGIKTIIV